ncbi:MAG: NADH-quinone oxidoreductase subunit M [Thermoanaerobaculaceae bacterium]|nr:NADH-quinone oxidoreductase subunit M [Thermoanaerobaculaceae bacterium]MDI9622371.1 NADH-quinone oxidoreductase subunit M [Acidobacteriota bacterium]NLH10741.1 NADH-quinone oxidoreductase subunit M [Holophagae bacterium]HPW56579.1 NADH-quinone oxidoreductase subunit M [Thermoanaerobaculaceae bacterium]
MEFFANPLNQICYLPLLGALVIIFFLKREQSKAIKVVATVTAGLDFVISIPLWWRYLPEGNAFQLTYKASWIPSIGSSYHFGVDGISVLLILLTTLLGFIAVYSSFSAITHREKEYYVFLLVLQTGMLGVFMALDFVLFYVFWEVMLVPMYFLIGIWGGPRKLYAAIKFFLYTLAGSVLMLVGILALYFYNSTGLGAVGLEGLGNPATFDVPTLFGIAGRIPPGLQMWIFLAFFVGFAIKVPMFPFHTWLPDAHVEAPTAGSVILAGVLLKMGTYGFIRFSLPLLPDATQKAVPWMVGLAIVGIIYGALVAMAQKDMKKLVAYSSVSHLGFVMLGMFALNPSGLSGSVLQMINHGLSTGGLFLLVGIVYERRHTRMIADYGGLAKVMPVYATLFMIITMASIGLPTLNGFVGELTILIGAFNRSTWWAVLAASGIVLGAAYMLWLYQRVFFGDITHEENHTLTDVNRREQWTLIPLVVLCFWIGLYPKPFFRIMEPSIRRVVEVVDPGYLAHPRLPAVSTVPPPAHGR